jgi:hypothetical protein
MIDYPIMLTFFMYSSMTHHEYQTCVLEEALINYNQNT